LLLRRDHGQPAILGGATDLEDRAFGDGVITLPFGDVRQLSREPPVPLTVTVPLDGVPVLGGGVPVSPELAEPRNWALA